MEKLNYNKRIGLSKLLDPCKTGCDWQALADKLGLRTMMEGHIGDHSPTRLLLTYFEVSTITTIRELVCRSCWIPAKQAVIGRLWQTSWDSGQ